MAKYQSNLNVYLAKSDRHFDKGQVYCLELVEDLDEGLVEVETSTF